MVPVRKPKQEASLIALLHIPYYVGRGDRLCTVRGHDLQHNCWRAKAGKPICTKAEDPNKSRGKTETQRQGPPSPKRHLQHPVYLSTRRMPEKILLRLLSSGHEVCRPVDLQASGKRLCFSFLCSGRGFSFPLHCQSSRNKSKLTC